jgi:hypothetical protein
MRRAGRRIVDLVTLASDCGNLEPERSSNTDEGRRRHLALAETSADRALHGWPVGPLAGSQLFQHDLALGTAINIDRHEHIRLCIPALPPDNP